MTTHDHRQVWDDGDVAALRQHFANGLSAKDIAERMGRTPKAVSSKLYRMGLCR